MGCQVLAAGVGGEGFGLVVLDPPWENASAARGAKYAALPSRALLRLPLAALLNPVSGLWIHDRPLGWLASPND